MNRAILIGLAVAAVLSGLFAVRAVQKRPALVPQRIVEKYNLWRAKYGRLLSTPAETDYRLRVFWSQSELVDQYNLDYEERLESSGQPKLSGPMFEINHFADLSDEEFSTMHTAGRRDQDIEITAHTEEDFIKPFEERNGLGAAYDIRIRNQGVCGSCWAFASVATAEKYYHDKKAQRVNMSQQELVDCERQSSGCNGGGAPWALGYIKSNGIQLTNSYPYAGVKQNAKRLTLIESTFPILHLFLALTTLLILARALFRQAIM